jgi:hypothetical protein
MNPFVGSFFVVDLKINHQPHALFTLNESKIQKLMKKNNFLGDFYKLGKNG